MGIERSDCLEVRGLAVDSSTVGAGLGSKLMLGCWAIGQLLSKRLIVGATGTRDRQAQLHGRVGGLMFPGVQTAYSPEYDEDLVAMYFDLDNPPIRVVQGLSVVVELLKLPNTGYSLSGQQSGPT
jgi:hypothetical protein